MDASVPTVTLEHRQTATFQAVMQLEFDNSSTQIAIWVRLLFDIAVRHVAVDQSVVKKL